MTPSRAQKSVTQLNEEYAAGKELPIDIIHDFFDSIDASCIEERLADLSPPLRKHIEEYCWNNIIAFDGIIEDVIADGRYVDGWLAIRDWARRQPWAEEARIEMEPYMAREREWLAARQANEHAGPNLSEQGRMLGILRVHLMRAQTDEERAEISKQIDELTAEFEKINRT